MFFTRVYSISQFKKKTSTIKIVQLPYNQGLGKALNEGLKHCTYDIVARMDTDDIAKLDPRFYDVINDIAFAPLAIQLFANGLNNDTPISTAVYEQPISSHTPAHVKANQARTKVYQSFYTELKEIYIKEIPNFKSKKLKSTKKENLNNCR